MISLNQTNKKKLKLIHLLDLLEIICVAEKGDFVVREGEVGDGIYFVWEGEVCFCYLRTLLFLLLLLGSVWLLILLLFFLFFFLTF